MRSPARVQGRDGGRRFLPQRGRVRVVAEHHQVEDAPVGLPFVPVEPPLDPLGRFIVGRPGQVDHAFREHCDGCRAQRLFIVGFPPGLLQIDRAIVQTTGVRERQRHLLIAAHRRGGDGEQLRVREFFQGRVGRCVLALVREEPGDPCRGVPALLVHDVVELGDQFLGRLREGDGVSRAHSLPWNRDCRVAMSKIATM